MGFINDVNVFGVADPNKYPNPVMLTKPVYMPLKKLDLENVDLSTPERAISALRAHPAPTPDFAKAIEWLENENNWPSYLDAIHQNMLATPTFGRGFEIRRYRVALEFEDGDKIVLRESGDLEACKTYTEELKNTYISRGFIIKPEDKAIGIYRRKPDQVNGGTMEYRCSILRLSAISPRNRTATKDQRYPEVEEVKREKHSEENNPTV